MQRWTDLDQVPADIGPSVVTLGNFDGVHRGHRTVLERMVRTARDLGGPAVALTFDPHPLQVHRPGSAPPLLTGVTDRLELLAETGLDAVLLLTYTERFARATPEDFVRTHLVEALRAQRVVVGHDVRFGRDNAGDLGTMVELGRRHGFDVEVVHDVHGHDADGRDADRHAHRRSTPGRRWSSTWVRELLAAGDVRAAAEILGRPHRVRGEVVHGDARGRALGYPTANLGGTQGMVPADGVYAGHLVRPSLPVHHPDRRLPVAVSVGTNPTFDGVGRRVEAHVPGRTDLDLYGEEVVVELVELLRPTVRFESVDALVAQMGEDVRRTRTVLGLPARDR